MAPTGHHGVSDESTALSTTAAASASAEPEHLLVDDSQLIRLDARPPLRRYLKQLWQRRHFIRAEARTNAFKNSRDLLLGKLWIVLDPLVQVTVYAFIFGLVLKVSRGIENFIGFLVIGVIFFGFFSKGFTDGSGLIRRSRGMISSFSFPRAAVPLSSVLRQLLDNAVPALVAVLIAILLQLDRPVHWTVIFVLPLYFLIHIFVLGSTLIVSRATAFIPDLKAIVSLFARGLFFISGVFFSIERFSFNPLLQDIMIANPIYQFLQAIRGCVMAGHIPHWTTWLYLTVWSFGLLIIGLIYFWRAEERYDSVK